MNIVFDVVFKLFKYVIIAKTDKPDVTILLTTFNVDMHVEELFKVVEPFNIVVPDTFNDDNNVVALLDVVVPETFNEDKQVVAPCNLVVDDTCKIPLIDVELHKTLLLQLLRFHMYLNLIVIIN